VATSDLVGQLRVGTPRSIDALNLLETKLGGVLRRMNAVATGGSGFNIPPGMSKALAIVGGVWRGGKYFDPAHGSAGSA
jgi:hypothetical protein